MKWITVCDVWIAIIFVIKSAGKALNSKNSSRYEINDFTFCIASVRTMVCFLNVKSSDRYFFSTFDTCGKCDTILKFPDATHSPFLRRRCDHWSHRLCQGFIYSEVDLKPTDFRHCCLRISCAFGRTCMGSLRNMRVKKPALRPVNSTKAGITYAA